MQLKEEYAILIARHFKGETSVEEENQLKTWISESDQNKRAYEELKFLWSEGKKPVPLVAADVEIAWKKVKQKAGLGEPVKDGKVRTLFDSYFMKVAASLLLVLVAGYFLKDLFKGDQLVEIASGNQKKEIVLPDGSKVYLNKNSAIAYSQNKFNKKERTVFMEGEVFFEVKKDSIVPFIVQSVRSTTRVLGTSFNVRSFSGEKSDNVQVVTGKVSFQAKDKEDQKLILLPGDQAAVHTGGVIEKITTENSNALAWQTGKLNFENASLVEVTATAENYFDIDIQIADSSLADCRFTGSFVKPKPEELMKILSVSMNLSWEKADSTYILTGEGCK